MTALQRHLVHGVAVLAAAATIVAGMTGVARAAEPPANDDLANAAPIALGDVVTADLTGATTEDGEPTSACSNVGHTVWYDLTLAQDAVVELDTAGSATDTLLVVWDDPALIDPYVCANDDGDVVQARATFAGRAGVTYLVQVGVDGEKGAEPGLLQLAAREAAKPTGKPQTFGSRDASLAAGAFWSLPMSGEDEYHVVQLDVSDSRQRSTGATPDRRLDVQLQSHRLTVVDGLRYADEWFGRAQLTREQLGLRDGLRSATVDVVLPLERYRCISTGPDDVESQCSELPGETVRIRATWTGTGEAQRELLRLSDRGFGYHTVGTRQLAWRDAAVTAELTGGTLELTAPAAAAVLVRDGVSTFHWWRG